MARLKQDNGDMCLQHLVKIKFHLLSAGKTNLCVVKGFACV